MRSEHAAAFAPGRSVHAAAFAPGRVNVIGEHTDYNNGLALPFAVTEGVTVDAQAIDPHSSDARRIYAHAHDLNEEDEFELADIPAADGWRAFVRGVAAELSKAGYPPVGARLQIGGDLQQGAGLSSSAALEVALCLALASLAEPAESKGAPEERALEHAESGGALEEHELEHAERLDPPEEQALERFEIARLCARVENEWAGAQTGMLDQLASLFGVAETALCIDFRSLQIDLVPLKLEGWRFVVLDSGERHANASSGYNERHEECRRASELLGVQSLREASPEALAGLPEPLRARAEHVLSENSRVLQAVAALRAQDLAALGELLNESHRSLRDLYEVSTPAVERTVEWLRDDGAAGARLMGGGFGGSVLGLIPPGVAIPPQAREVRPGAGAHVLSG